MATSRSAIAKKMVAWNAIEEHPAGPRQPSRSAGPSGASFSPRCPPAAVRRLVPAGTVGVELQEAAPVRWAHGGGQDDRAPAPASVAGAAERCPVGMSEAAGTAALPSRAFVAGATEGCPVGAGRADDTAEMDRTAARPALGGLEVRRPGRTNVGSSGFARRRGRRPATNSSRFLDQPGDLVGRDAPDVRRGEDVVECEERMVARDGILLEDVQAGRAGPGGWRAPRTEHTRPAPCRASS